MLTTKCNKKEFFDIFYYIRSLHYSDKPNYEFIRNRIKELLNFEIMKSSVADKSLVNLLTNNFFSNKNEAEGISNEVLMNKKCDSNLHQKDIIRNTSGYLSPQYNDLIFEKLPISNPTLLQNFLNFNAEQQFDNEILKKKRLRNTDIYKEIIEKKKSENNNIFNNVNTCNNYRNNNNNNNNININNDYNNNYNNNHNNYGICNNNICNNNICNNNLNFKILDQLISRDLKFLEFVNYLNNCYKNELNKIETDINMNSIYNFLKKVNNIVDFVRIYQSTNTYNNNLFGYNKCINTGYVAGNNLF